MSTEVGLLPAYQVECCGIYPTSLGNYTHGVLTALSFCTIL